MPVVVIASEKLHMMLTTEGAIDTRMDQTHLLDGMSGNEHNLPQVPLIKEFQNNTVKRMQDCKSIEGRQMMTSGLFIW